MVNTCQLRQGMCWPLFQYLIIQSHDLLSGGLDAVGTGYVHGVAPLSKDSGPDRISHGIPG